MSVATPTITMIPHHPYVFRPAVVVRTRRLTPRMLRITFGGSELDAFTSPGVYDDIRLVLPEDINDTPVPPKLLLNPRRLEFPDGAPPTVFRAYTVRGVDPAAGTIDVDFALHGEGPACRWAERARPGMPAVVGGPHLSRITEGFDAHLLIGDETALPAIARAYESLPASTFVHAIIEIEDKREEQRFAVAPDAVREVTWLHRASTAPGTTDLLARAVRQVPLPPGAVHVFVAGEAATARTIRRYFIDELGLDRRSLHCAGYWRRGDDLIGDLDEEE